MQSYQEQTSVSQLDPLPGTSTTDRSGGSGGGRTGDELHKWRTRYEEAMNPFEAFRGRVRIRLFCFCVCFCFFFLFSSRCGQRLIHRVGGYESVRSAQRCRTGCVGSHSGNTWKPPGSDCVHMLRCRVASAGHVYLVPMGDIVRVTATSTTWTLLIPTLCGRALSRE